MVRIDPEAKRLAKSAAAVAGMSLEAWLNLAVWSQLGIPAIARGLNQCANCGVRGVTVNGRGHCEGCAL